MAHAGRLFRGGHDVGGEDGGGDHIALGGLATACEKPFDLVEERVGVCDEVIVVFARQFDVLGAGNVLSQVSTGSFDEQSNWWLPRDNPRQSADTRYVRQV